MRSKYISLILIATLMFVTGCAKTNQLADDFDRKVEKGFVEIKDVEKKYNNEVKEWYKNKREFYIELRETVYPKIVNVISDNWDNFTEKEQDVLLEAKEKAEKLDSRLAEMDKKLKEYDQKLQEKFDSVDQAYDKYKELRAKKQEIQDVVDKLIDGASVINN